MQKNELVDKGILKEEFLSFTIIKNNYLFDLFDWWQELLCSSLICVFHSIVVLHSKLLLHDFVYSISSVSVSNCAMHIVFSHYFQ